MIEQSLYSHLRHHLPDVPVVQLTKATLVHLSHTLEDIVLRDRLPAMLFTGFQESSHWHDEIERYEQLSEVAQQVCVFAGKPLPPESAASQLHVELAEGDPLRQEWFLILLSSGFCALLCGQDTLAPVAGEPDRLFDTLWSFEPQVINQALDQMEDVVAHYRPERLITLQEARRHLPPTAPDPALIGRFVADLTQLEATLNHRLRWQQSLLNTLLGTIPHHLFVIDLTPDGRYTLAYQSPNLDHLLAEELPREGVIGDLLLAAAHPDDRDRLLAFMQALAPGRSDTIRLRLMRQDSPNPIWVENTITPTQDPAAGITRLFGVIRDITAEHEAEKMRHLKERLLSELDKQLEINAVKSYFMTTVMHEFRTPLATILSSADMMERYEERYTREQRLGRLAGIREQVMGLTRLLDDIAVIVNGDIRQLGFMPEPTDVGQVIEDMVQRARLLWGETHNFTAEIAPEIGQQPIDPRLIKHVLKNLLDNAARFSPAQTTVRVQAALMGDSLQVAVADSGIGIPAEDQPHIFETFYRGHNARNVGGAGLGLKIVAECVALHRGSITVDSEEGHGATFTLRLPVDGQAGAAAEG